jgi:hypothetical protein
MAFDGHLIDSPVLVNGKGTFTGILELGITTTTGTERTIQCIGSEANITLDLITKGTGIIRVPSGYEANINNDRHLVNRAFVNSKVAGIAISSLVSAPGVGQNNFVVTYDHSNTRYTLAAVPTGKTYGSGLEDVASVVKLGGTALDRHTDIIGNFNLNLGTTGNKLAAFQLNVTGQSSLVSGTTQIHLNGVNPFTVIGGVAGSSFIIDAGGGFLITDLQAGASQRGLKGSADFSANSTSNDFIQKVYADNRIGGKNVFSLITAPGVGQHNFAVIWDNTNNRYTLGSVGGGGGGGITNSAPSLNLMKSDGTNAIDSGLTVTGASGTITLSGLNIVNSAVRFGAGTTPSTFAISKQLEASNTGSFASSIATPFRLLANSTIGPITAGIGVGMDFVVSTNTIGPNFEIGGALYCLLSDATSGAEYFDISLRTMRNGSGPSEIIKFAPIGIGTSVRITTPGSLELNPAGILQINSNTIVNNVAKFGIVGDSTIDRRLHVEENTPNGTSTLYPIRLTSISTGSISDDFGTGIEFEVETASSNNEIGATIEALVIDRTSAAENFDLVFRTMVSGATAIEQFRISNLLSYFRSNIQLGISGVSGDRTISVSSSTTDSSLFLQTQGSGSFFFTGTSWGNGGLEIIGNSSITTIRRTITNSSLGNIQIVGAIGITSQNNGGDVSVVGGNGFGSSGNGNGGNILITSGQRRIAGSGVDGNIALDFRIGNLSLGSSSGSFGSGQKVIFINNATTNPSTNPTGGIINYSDSGIWKYRDTSGNIITI